MSAALSLFAAAASASPDWQLVELRSRLSALSDALRPDTPMRDRDVPGLVGDLGIPELGRLKTPPLVTGEAGDPAELSWTDKRIALAAMTQIYGGGNNAYVIEAGRKDDTEALEITSGVLTLDQLRKRLTPRHLGLDMATGTDILRVPLVIGREAVLHIGPEEKLLLSQEDGAFLVNFGRLEVYGGEISGTPAKPEAREVYSPFIVSVGSGTVHISGAVFRRLGFGYTAKFAGFSILSHPTMQPNERNIIQNSRFDDLVTVALVGVRHVEIKGNRFYDMRRNPLLISQSRDSVVEANLFSGASPTNAVRISNGSDDSRLVRNVVLEGSRAGLLVSSGSDNVVVAENLIWRRNGGGVKLQDVRCGQVERNLIIDDRQKGIEVRNSPEAFLSTNRIIGNANAGIWISSQPTDNVTYVLDNLIRENGSGVSTAVAGRIAMAGNDLSNQFPRFLDGDVTLQFRAIVADMKGESPIYLQSGGVQPAGRLTPAECDL